MDIKNMQITNFQNFFCTAVAIGGGTLTWTNPDSALGYASAIASGIALSQLAGALYSEIFPTCNAGIGCMGCFKSNGKVFHRIKPIAIRHNQKDHTPENKAAIAIQKHIRGYLERRFHLAPHLYAQYKILCDRVEGPESHSMPLAQAGHTRVYLPREMPDIVLKKSGSLYAVRRFHQMQSVREILISQKSSCLIIPRASLCGDYLVEQRLPIDPDHYYNMELYLSEPKLFDESVRELTKLFSRKQLSDLITPGGAVRYDNLPLCIVEEKGQKKGKICLIDLEGIGPESHGLETLVRIFPFQLDVIKEVANELKWSFDENSLNVSAEEGKKYLRAEFTLYRDWLKQKSSPSQPFQVSEKRVEELTLIVKNELLQINEGVSSLFSQGMYFKIPKNFFLENSEETARELSHIITSKIIKNIEFQIEQRQDKDLGMLLAEEMTDSQLMRFRSPCILFSGLANGVGTMILEDKKIKFEDTIFGGHDIPKHLVRIVMEQLVLGGEIYSFDFNKDWLPQIRY